MSYHQHYKIIMPARFIPDGTTVYKPTGSTPYEIYSNMRLYADDNMKEEVKPVQVDIEGAKYLHGHSSISVVNEDKPLAIWFESLMDMLKFCISMYDDNMDYD